MGDATWWILYMPSAILLLAGLRPLLQNKPVDWAFVALAAIWIALRFLVKT